ncbi:MAG: arylsulfatase, partial [Verrucomicrobiota bacterium]
FPMNTRPLLAALFYFAASNASHGADRAFPTKPNILFVLTDDTGYGDLSAHGHPLLKTPNLDRLERESVRFQDFHVSPTCAPTRSALLTGRHEFKNGITHTILERERLTPQATTLAQVLQKAGYSTGIFGKWHLGDEDEYQPQKRGFDEVFIHGGGGIGQTYPGSCGDAPGNLYFNPAIRHNGTFEKTEGFCTDIFTTQAMHWVEGLPKEKPFFCYIPFNAAHEPFSCPESDKAPYEAQAPGKLATYFGMVANIDTNIGRLLDWLERTGRAQNTLLIFMNDNGCDGTAAKFFNAGMHGAKGSPWFGGTRAVSLWRWPSALTPHDCTALTAHIDVFPTLASLAGAPINAPLSEQVEGLSLVPLLQDGAAPWPERTLATHVGRWPKGADVQQYKFSQASLRSGPWHLVWDQRKENPLGADGQLFNLTQDPAEQQNLAANNPEQVAQMKSAYEQWWNSVVPSMVNETAVGPKINPFKEAYWRQFGGGPSAEDLKRMSPETK